MHTTYSDGRWSAEELLDHLTQEDFGLVAITDHDRVETVASIQDLGEQKHVHVLAGVEMSAQWHDMMADVLCYGFNPHDETMRTLAEQVRQGQKANAEEVYQELLRRGHQFPRRGEVLKAKAGELRVAGDCANMLIKHGYNNQVRPSKELIARIAIYFNYDHNNLLLAAGKVPPNVLEILRAYPEEAIALLHERFGRRQQ